MILPLNNETGSMMAFKIYTQSKIVNGNAVKSRGAFFTRIAQKTNTKARKTFKTKSNKWYVSPEYKTKTESTFKAASANSIFLTFPTASEESRTIPFLEINLSICIDFSFSVPLKGNIQLSQKSEFS
ncbi:hypothetical protein [Rasiella sp. SM2506]|uniref:hypothetical protein n=1 Tax=Rasiella sp. SM2506 TaxID=3423914 RepID=UPI003D793117